MCLHTRMQSSSNTTNDMIHNYFRYLSSLKSLSSLKYNISMSVFIEIQQSADAPFLPSERTDAQSKTGVTPLPHGYTVPIPEGLKTGLILCTVQIYRHAVQRTARQTHWLM